MWAVLPGSARPEESEEPASATRVRGAEAGAPPSDDDEPHSTTPVKRRRSVRYYDNSQETNEVAEGKEAGGRRANRNSCFLCGDWSHHAYACPNDRCIICLDNGHQQRDCPKGNRPCVCSACGRVGHLRVDCTLVQHGSEELSDSRCIACGEYGHLDCSPLEKRPRNISCFNCGAKGHLANDCDSDGFDRWQRLFAQTLSSRPSRSRSFGSSYGDGRPHTSGSVISMHRGPPPSMSLGQLMSPHPGGKGSGGKGGGSASHYRWR